MVIKWSWWLLFLIILFVLSYIREISFLSVNAIINGESFFYAKTIEFPFLRDWNTPELNYLKYILTAVFSLLFIAFTFLGLKVSIANKLYSQLSILLYCSLIAIAGLFILYSIAFSSINSNYLLLRKMVGLIHNPILYILISITAVVYKKNTT